ncbi:hypothetical protein CEXT_719001 [Caerostris extrusa]|uniref:Uncharacterized protein n=1 Tax=Caerostris extrusa TaxID=172846 RepID=A0AAV4V4K0_CAEEX|nr:hypothetical protein CEXT_719001 [Caerostris extrusa]
MSYLISKDTEDRIRPVEWGAGGGRPPHPTLSSNPLTKLQPSPKVAGIYCRGFCISQIFDADKKIQNIISPYALQHHTSYLISKDTEERIRPGDWVGRGHPHPISLQQSANEVAALPKGCWAFIGRPRTSLIHSPRKFRERKEVIGYCSSRGVLEECILIVVRRHRIFFCLDLNDVAGVGRQFSGVIPVVKELVFPLGRCIRTGVGFLSEISEGVVF